MPNKIRFTVGGINYSVYSEDSEEYIRSIALELERKMDKLARNNHFLSTTMVAVLAAMDSADALKKCEMKYEALRKENEELTAKCVIARRDADFALRQLEELKNGNG